MAEVGIIAEQCKRGDACDDHCHQDGRTVVFLEGSVHFFYGEDDARQRGVECGGDTGGGAGEDQPFFHIVSGEAGEIAQAVHDGCADLHGGPFPAHGRTAEQPEDGERDLAEYDAKGKHALADDVVWVKRCDRLWDAAALRSGKNFLGGDNDQRESERGDQQRQVGRNGKHLVEQAVCPFGSDRKEDGNQPDTDCAAPEHEPAFPVENQRDFQQ